MVLLLYDLYFFNAFCSVLMSAYSKLGDFFVCASASTPTQHHGVNTSKSQSLVHIMPNSMKKRRRRTNTLCDETNRQTRKGSKYFALCLFSHLIFNIHSLSSSMVIISRIFFYSFSLACADVRHSQSVQKDFSKSMNGIDCWILKRSDSVLCSVCCAFCFNSFYFIHSCIHSLRRLFFRLFRSSW